VLSKLIKLIQFALQSTKQPIKESTQLTQSTTS
jgi:hypothetical protein